LAVGLTYLGVEKPWRGKAIAGASAVPSADKSVAVLPFEDLSENKDQAYFSDGLSEELIELLAKVPGLRVPARTSSFYFKEKQATLEDIAKALSVANVLEGSVRKSGQTLRITTELVRIQTGTPIWSETFDRQLDDIFKIQDEIAGAVVASRRVSLLSGAAPRAIPTTNTEAYTHYLKCLQARNLETREDYVAGVAECRRAVELDPRFAAAWQVLGIPIAASSWRKEIPPTRKLDRGPSWRFNAHWRLILAAPMLICRLPTCCIKWISIQRRQRRN
jgi:adenylate cyclase